MDELWTQSSPITKIIFVAIFGAIMKVIMSDKGTENPAVMVIKMILMFLGVAVAIWIGSRRYG